MICTIRNVLFEIIYPERYNMQEELDLGGGWDWHMPLPTEALTCTFVSREGKTLGVSKLTLELKSSVFADLDCVDSPIQSDFSFEELRLAFSFFLDFDVRRITRDTAPPLFRIAHRYHFQDIERAVKAFVRSDLSNCSLGDLIRYWELVTPSHDDSVLGPVRKAVCMQARLLVSRCKHAHPDDVASLDVTREWHALFPQTSLMTDGNGREYAEFRQTWTGRECYLHHRYCELVRVALFVYLVDNLTSIRIQEVQRLVEDGVDTYGLTDSVTDLRFLCHFFVYALVPF